MTYSHHLIQELQVLVLSLPEKGQFLLFLGPGDFSGFLSYFAPGGAGSGEVGSVRQPQQKAELVCAHKAAQSQQVCEECLFVQTTGLTPDSEPCHATQHCQRSSMGPVGDSATGCLLILHLAYYFLLNAFTN